MVTVSDFELELTVMVASLVSSLVLSANDTLMLALPAPDIVLGVAQFLLEAIVHCASPMMLNCTVPAGALADSSVVDSLKSVNVSLGDWVIVTSRTIVPLAFDTLIIVVRDSVDEGLAVTVMVAFCVPRPLLGMMLRIHDSLHVMVQSQF